MAAIFFKREGYDPFIDYVKGICILWVVLTHAISTKMHDYTLFCLWGDMAVPIFLLIQCVHVYKKEKQALVNWNKIWQRIIKPFLILQLFILVLGVVLDFAFHRSPMEFINTFALLGGYGRGSYYPKMYLEFALLIPIMYPAFKRNSLIGGGILLFVSVCVEVLFSYIDFYLIWQWIGFRYLMIVYFGYVIATKGIEINVVSIMFSILGILSILFFQYSNVNFEPVFYDNPWRIYHWPIYGFVAYLLVALLWYAYKHTQGRPYRVILLMGKYSYEIFLFQMFVFFISDYGLQGIIVEKLHVHPYIYMFFLVVASIYPVLKYEQLKKSHESI